MLDPMSALSLAAAIVQFVDFGSGILVDGYRSYRSAEGAAQENVDIEDAAVELGELCERLWQAPPFTTGSPSKGEVALSRLAQDCQRVAKDLTDMLDGLKVTSTGPWRTWEAARQAARRAWKLDKIEKMQKRLETIRSQINTQLLDLLRTSQSSVMTAMYQLTSKTESLGMQTTIQLSETRKTLLEAIQRQERELKALRSAMKSGSSQGNSYYVVVNSYQDSVDQLANKIDVMQEQGRVIATTQRILDNLRFKEMPMRHSDIREAHSGTYSWIFDTTRTRFRNWLQSENGIFWISGKAGSGKSTLLKFLDSHTETEVLLSDWASQNNRRLVRASFYFWHSGIPIQRTQEGLLRSLLFQILRQCPDLVPIAFPSRWAADKTFHSHEEPWSRSELSGALNTVLTHGVANTMPRFCFFIDGLDEYEGDHYQLTKDLFAISNSEFVKLCVSSRPWTEFTDAFSHDVDRMMVLQDLTRSDMEKYIRGMLGEDERFERLCREDPRGQVFITEILDKAQGVFLWVFLVVRSMRDGLTRHDDIATLRARLNDLPSDLEEYFRHILKTIDKVYRAHTARTFQLAVRATSLPLIAFWYLPVEVKNPEYLLEEPVAEPLSSKDAHDFREKATYRINAWCRDLLEVHELPLPMEPRIRTSMERNVFLRHRIEFLHRTVRDFLLLKDIQTELAECIDTPFNPWLTLVRVYLFEAKSLNMSSGNDYAMRTFLETAGETMHYAKEHEVHMGTSPIALVDELDKVGTYYRALDNRSARRSHWTNVDSELKSDFLAYAVTFGLTIYVREVLKREQAVSRRRDPSILLHFALHRCIPNTRIIEHYPPNKEMVEMLLEMGANPNFAIDTGTHNRTVWQHFLVRCYRTADYLLWPAVEPLIRAGADLRAQVVVGYIDTVTQSVKWHRNVKMTKADHATVESCLQSCCPRGMDDKLQELIGFVKTDSNERETPKRLWRKLTQGSILGRD